MKIVFWSIVVIGAASAILLASSTTKTPPPAPVPQIQEKGGDLRFAMLDELFTMSLELTELDDPAVNAVIWPHIKKVQAMLIRQKEFQEKQHK